MAVEPVVIAYEASRTMAAFHASDAFVRGIKGPFGCTDGDTEFLTPTGWRRIADYLPGDVVAQWSPDGSMTYVHPEEYIAGPCEEMWLFENHGSVSMALSDNHRMPLYDWSGKFVVKTADHVARKPSKHVVPSHFTTVGGLGLSSAEIRLRVMIAADGHYHKAGKRCVVCVRKDRKKDRIRSVLTECGIEWMESARVARPTETCFMFDRPDFAKPLHLSANWYQASTEELAVLLEECLHWDGTDDFEEHRFFSVKREEADVVQFAAHACGRTSHVLTVPQKKANHKDLYVVSWTAKGSRKGRVGLRCDNINITRIRPENDMQYCFRVPSSFWIARRKGCIFVTGNSGKSVACCNEIISRAVTQNVMPDGKRRSRWGVIRNTYPELRTTTIKTWCDWFGPISKFRWDQPITAQVNFNDVELELIFVSLDRPDDINKLLSLDLTGIWVNEARELPKAVIDAATGRVDRYPAKKDGGSAWTGLIMDTNPPDDSHWWYREAEVNRPEGWKFFHQPPALLKIKDGVYVENPEAENIQHLNGGYNYYIRQLAGKTAEWIKVYVLGQYGTIADGKPVYSEYRDDFHCAPDILPVMGGMPLILGWDYGRTPVCIVGQLSPRGQLRIIDEICVDTAGDGMGIRTFTRDVVKPYLAKTYPNIPIQTSWGDPAGAAKDSSELSCFDIQAQEGIPTERANTNDITPRCDAVVKYLTTVSDGEPGFLLSPKCVTLRRGFLGAYRYTRVQVSGEERYKEVPDKNAASHSHDGLQYLALAAWNANVVEKRYVAKPVTPRSAAGWT